MKQVIYNGSTQSYYGCTKPTELVVGRTYEVITEVDRGIQIDYELNGISGSFDSLWFDIPSDIPTHFAFSQKIPRKGERYECNKIDLNEDGLVITEVWKTSPVMSIEVIGKNTYKVYTHSSIYLVTVM